MTTDILLQPLARATKATLAICCVAVAFSFFASYARAGEFAIKNFNVELTESSSLRELSHGSYEVVNESYKVPFTQAGAHPWAVTMRGGFATEEANSPGEEPIPVPSRDPRDVVLDLPPGLLGDPMAVPRCPLTLVTNGSEQCPADTQIGEYSIRLGGGHQLVGPIVNVTPEAGQSAEFALENTVKVQTPLATGRLVRTKQGYGFDVVSAAIPLLGIESFEITVWGVPADPSHDQLRGLFCKRPSVLSPLECGAFGGGVSGGEHFGFSPIVPFLTMGTDCAAGPETVTMRADSWEEPGSVGTNGEYSSQWKVSEAPWPYADSGVTGCDLLSFQPTLEARPSTLLADEAAGLNVNLKVPLSETPGSFATPQIRDSTVTLPSGLSVNPSIVDGIQACDEHGPEGINIEGPESEEVGLNGELQLAPGHCPNASIVGTAEAVTPFLPEPVKGHVFLARPGCGAIGQPVCTEQDALDGNLYKLYLELGGTGELARTGVHFKVPMQTQVNLATGQLTTRVLETPQAPFSELKIALEGGPRAPLATPAQCGGAVTTSDFTPWSAPGVLGGSFVAGTPDATPSSFFTVQGCSSPPPLNPGFTAGTVTANAGQFSTFTMALSRQDREQYVKGIQVHTPPGLSGVIAGVPLCGEAQADAGTCAESSKIGTTRVATGAGSHPFEIGGDIYLTGPYRGSPFGLSIVVHLDVGPFHLGVKVVRARIAVDPSDATLTVTTDESGPYAVPQIVFGVPVRLQHVSVNIDRHDFMFNPTNCAAQKVLARVSGSQDTVAQVESPFAVGACKSLAFKPQFSVTTNGRTSRAKGASLDARLSYPRGALGNDANIARVKVSLPKALPSRLKTLQHACPSAIFARNPASCPKESVVGVVKATTPLLPVELLGPAYFVSHGGEEFPNLIVVLQGDNVRADLVGTTFINKAGITSSTFKTVPDVPVGSFELYLPEGPFSALAANRNLCVAASKLTMPTEFVAQNGAVLKQTTKIRVSGCPSSRKRGAKK